MCGLAGVVRFAAAVSGPDDERLATILSGALAHRGPDGEGRYRSPDGRALLVHRRLAIIDPSVRAAQPMASADGRWHLVYNGEAYNYRELRAELRARGAALRTESDTEALLHLLALDGPSALARVRGMFALGLWDAHERTLLLARDRFGIKPLYVAQRAGGSVQRVGGSAQRADGVAFASEITALQRAGWAGRGVSPAGVLAFLAWGSIPQPLTWLSDVEALEPGTWSRWDAGGAAVSGRFANPAAAYVTSDQELDEVTLRRRTAEAVVDSVRAHLVADVPVGVFLSGGIDSGAIVSAARQVGSTNLHTYTVSVAEQAYSEAALAAATAQRFGTTHHDLRVDASQIARDLDAILGRLDQPTADAVNSYYVSRAVAATGVKAVLSGVGGDELFGGYPSFRRIPAGLSLGRALGPFMRVTGVAARALPAWRAAKWRHFVSAPRPKTAYRALRGFFMPEELTALVGPALRDRQAWDEALCGLAAAERRIFEPAGEETALASVARMETRAFLCSQLLRDIDVMSMAHGLEVRTPFVDHLLQQTVWPSLGAHPHLARGKRLLHETLGTALPEAVVSSPKRGFTLPFAVWLRGPLREMTREGIDALVARQWVDARAAERVWAEWDSGQAHWSRVWGLGILGRFLERAE
jgi:asparagine synthase (glutamine-hydrolysing)